MGFRAGLIFIGAVISVMAFQNCSGGTRVVMSGHASSQDADASGNGGTYDGKPDPGLYVRHFPDGCANAAKDKDVIGALLVNAKNAVITSDVCTEQNYAIEFGDSRLDYAKYNPEFVGFNGAIFEAKSAAESNPGLVELWCRHPGSETGVDVVVKSTGTALLYRGINLNTDQPTYLPRQSFAVQQSNSGQILSVSAPAQGLQLQVDLAAAARGIYSGEGQFQLDGQTRQLSLACRVKSNAPAVYAAPLNIVGLYQLDGSTGTGTLHNPDSRGAVYTGGKYGTALSMDGKDDYVDISEMAQKVSTQFTVGLWINPDLSIADDTAALTVNTASGGNVLKIGTGLCSGSGDRLRLSLEIDNACFDAPVVVVDGQWHHIAVAVSNGRATLYADGVEVTNQPLTFPLSTTDLWSLGQDYDGTKLTDFWLGLLDEVVIWSSALSAAEIAAAAGK